jgi:hypothetical protein
MLCKLLMMTSQVTQEVSKLEARSVLIRHDGLHGCISQVIKIDLWSDEYMLFGVWQVGGSHFLFLHRAAMAQLKHIFGVHEPGVLCALPRIQHFLIILVTGKDTVSSQVVSFTSKIYLLGTRESIGIVRVPSGGVNWRRGQGAGQRELQLYGQRWLVRQLMRPAIVCAVKYILQQTLSYLCHAESFGRYGSAVPGAGVSRHSLPSR